MCEVIVLFVVRLGIFKDHILEEDQGKLQAAEEKK